MQHWQQLVAMWVVFFCIGGVSYQAPPVLLPVLMRDFGASQYDVSWLPACFQLAKGLATMPGGWGMSSFGTMRCIRAGTLLIIAATAAYPFAQALWELALLHALQGLAYGFCGIGPVIVFATSWFKQQRAAAIGILLTAFALAGVVFPPVVAVLVRRLGWRLATGTFPALLVVVVEPLLLRVLRDGPLLNPTGTHVPVERAEDVAYLRELPQPSPVLGRTQLQLAGPGAAAAGDVEAGYSRGVAGRAEDARGSAADAIGASAYPAQCHSGPKAAIEDELVDDIPPNFWSALRLRAVWHLGLMSGYNLFVVIALLNTLVLYLEHDAGLPLEVCGGYASAVFTFSLIGKLLVGPALDTNRRFAAGLGSCLLLVLGTALILDIGPHGLRPTASHGRLCVFVVVYGLGYGTSYTVICSEPAKHFGRMPEFGKLQGFFMLFQVIGGFFGTLVTGKLRDVTGSYVVPFCVFVVMSVLALVHYAALGQHPLGGRSAARALEATAAVGAEVRRHSS